MTTSCSLTLTTNGGCPGISAHRYQGGPGCCGPLTSVPWIGFSLGIGESGNSSSTSAVLARLGRQRLGSGDGGYRGKEVSVCIGSGLSVRRPLSRESQDWGSRYYKEGTGE